MAQGDVIFFQQFLIDALEKVHDLENDVIQIGLVTSTTTPTEATANPHWGGTGTTNFATNQIAIAGAYTGPATLANPSVLWANNRCEIDWDDPAAWLMNAASPSTPVWGIIFNNTSTNKKCIGYVDIGGLYDMKTGDLSIIFGTPAAYLDHA